MSKLNPKKKISIRKLANELWLIPTILFAALILIEGIHLHAHYQMDNDVNSYVRNFLRKNPDFKD